MKSTTHTCKIATGKPFRKACGIAALLIWACGFAWANDAIEVVTSEADADAISEALVKVTWEAELKNTSNAAVTLTITCNLLDGEGQTIHTLSIDDFTIAAGETATAVQSRPVASATWDKVSDHEITTE